MQPKSAQYFFIQIFESVVFRRETVESFLVRNPYNDS